MSDKSDCNLEIAKHIENTGNSKLVKILPIRAYKRGMVLIFSSRDYSRLNAFNVIRVELQDNK